MRLLLVILRLQYLWTVYFEYLNLFTNVFNVFLNDFERIIELRASLVVVWHVIDVDLDEERPFLLLGRQLDCLLTRRFMLSTYIDSSCNIKNAFILR